MFGCLGCFLPSEPRIMVAVLSRTEISEVFLWSDRLAQGSSLPCALDCFGSHSKTPSSLNALSMLQKGKPETMHKT